MKSFAVYLIGLLASVSVASAEVPTVSGQVRLLDGSAVVGAQVLLFDVADLRRGALGQATTDADGRFALPLASLGTSGLPQGFALGQNYPNPFNPSTVIPYQLPTAALVRLEVFNVLGQRVATLVDGERPAGAHTAVWTATDEAGQAVSAGVYIYRLAVGDAMATGRMVLVDGQAGVPAAAASGPADAAALDGPVVASRSEMPVYGLAVFGDGLATYVDSAFVLGSGPVEVVLDGGLGKAVVQQDDPAIEWVWEDYDWKKDWDAERFSEEMTKRAGGDCFALTSPGQKFELEEAIEQYEENGFLIFKMPRDLYNCYTGSDAELRETLYKDLWDTIKSDGLIAGGVYFLKKKVVGALKGMIVATIADFAGLYSGVGDANFIANLAVSTLDRSAQATKLALLGPSTDKGKILMGSYAKYLPVFMVKLQTQTEETWNIELDLAKKTSFWALGKSPPTLHRHTEYKTLHESLDDLITITPGYGYFIIPPKRFYLKPTRRLVEYNPRSLRVSFELYPRSAADPHAWSWFKRDLGLAPYYGLDVFPFRLTESADAVYLDHQIRTADGDALLDAADASAVFRWYYVNNTAHWDRLLFEGPRGAVLKTEFDELVDGRGEVEIQLAVTIGDETLTQHRTVAFGDVEDDRSELVEGTERTFPLPVPEGDPPIDMAFVWIEPGVFQMGSDDGDSDERPVHEVEISRGFWLGKYEVTQGEWESVMGRNPSYFEGDARLPVETVSWNDVQEFIAKLNAASGSSVYRLPTEAEWEYACRAGTQTRWSLGDDDGDDASQLDKYAWYACNDDCDTKVVGRKGPNGWGLYDMHGNVWEWVQDWYSSGYYNSSPRVDPPGPTSGSFRVSRGGHVYYSARNVRSANRNYDSPDVRGRYIGVRLVRIR